MSHNWNKLASDWWLVLLSSPALAALFGAHVGSFMLGCASGARRAMGGPAHERTTLAALCSDSDRQHSAQLWQIRAAVHFHTFLRPAPRTQITPPPSISRPPNTLQSFRYRHHTSQHTAIPYTHLICRRTPHLSRRPLDYIKKSSPLSGRSKLTLLY